jgi:hypothetical protein
VAVQMQSRWMRTACFCLGDEEVVAMAVKEMSPVVWRTFAEDRGPRGA